MNKKSIYLIIIFIIILISYFYTNSIFTLDNLNHHYTNISKFIENNYFLSILCFFFIYFFSVVLCLPFAWFLTISGSMIFGWFLGSILSIFSAGIGACVVFLISTFILPEYLKKKIKSKEGMYYKLKKETQKNAFFYLLFARLIPVFPFFFINIAPVFMGIKFHTFAITTFLGIVPGALVYSLIGDGARQILLNGGLVEKKNLYSHEAFIGLIGLAILVVLPVIIRKIKLLKNKNKF